MTSNREECMISKETGVPIEKYKTATKNQCHFYILINLIKLINQILMK